jgi:hypothetical protein
MRIHVPGTVLGLAFALAAPAHAQTIITSQPVATAPAAVRTVTTTRTVRPIARHRVVVTRRTYVTDRVVPSSTTTTTTTIAPVAVAAPYPGPLYDTVVQTPPPVAPAPIVTPAAVPVTAPIAAGTEVPFDRYVYQPDRILVIDPATGVAVQAIPR